jgi:3',5'-cyclic AMP phosphodiesterase CpdA
VAGLRPGSPRDWLIVAGNVAEKAADIEWALGTLGSRFATVIWVPGNHEQWTLSTDPVRLRGEARYQYLVSACRRLGVLTPEDPFPVWTGAGGPVVIVPRSWGRAAARAALSADHQPRVVDWPKVEQHATSRVIRQGGTGGRPP